MKVRRVALWSLAACMLALLPAAAWSAEKRKPVVTKPRYVPEHESVEMFEAIESGKIEVRLMAKSSKLAKIYIENKTDKPLNVKLPEAFVGVLAQFDQGGGGLGGGGGNQQFGGGNNFGGGGQQGNNFFNVPAGGVGSVKAPCVCLEHGKKEPRPRIKYIIKPVEYYSKDPALKELLLLFSRGKFDQSATQAAAWHIANKMSWQQLAAKRIRHLNGVSEPYFSQGALRLGFRMAAAARQRAAQGGQTPPASLSDRVGVNQRQ